jgi:hypothetical protein
LFGEFAKYVGMTKYQTMDEFTRAELSDFVRRFQNAQQNFYSLYTNKLIVLLRKFLAVDVAMNKAVIENVTGQTTTQRYTDRTMADEPSILGPAAVKGTKKANDKLWASLSAAPIPANGMTLSQMLNSFSAKSTIDTRNLLMQGYANASSVSETFDGIVGTNDAAFRNGLFAQFITRNNAVLATALQHISRYNFSAIASVYFNEYEWVSIMDGHTTDICILRNGNIYVYGQGPIPPAHWGCRSNDVPRFEDGAAHDVPPSFYDWISNQPDHVVSDMLGSTKLSDIRNGLIDTPAFSSIYAVTALSLSEYRDKLPFILYQEDNQNEA